MSEPKGGESSSSAGRIPHSTPWLHQRGEDVLLDLLVTPRSSRNRVMGIHDDRLKIQLTAPPVDDKANHALARFVAETLEISRAQVSIVGGHSSRRKTVSIKQVSAQKILLKLTPHR